MEEANNCYYEINNHIFPNMKKLNFAANEKHSIYTLFDIVLSLSV